MSPLPGPGRARQETIFRDGVLGRVPAVPTDPAALEHAARKAMSKRAWAYVAGGATDCSITFSQASGTQPGQHGDEEQSQRHREGRQRGERRSRTPAR